jgi:hypothetical protein
MLRSAKKGFVVVYRAGILFPALTLIVTACVVPCISSRCSVGSAQRISRRPVVLSSYILPPDAVTHYHWFGDNKIVYSRTGTDAQAMYVMRNVATGVEEPLDGLSKLADRYHPGSLDLAFSAGGGRVAWICGESDCTLIVATTGGSVILTKPGIGNACQLYWSNDGSKLVYFTVGTVREEPIGIDLTFFSTANVVSVGALPSVKTHPLSPDSELGGKSYLSWMSPLGLPFFHFNGPNSFVVCTQQPGAIEPGGEVVFGRYGSFDRPGPDSSHAIRLPDGRALVNASVSPNGGYVIWYVKWQSKYEIWLSAIGGIPMQKICDIAPDGGPVQSYLDPTGLKWLPSGKAISFQSGGQLCVANVEELLKRKP